MPESIRLICFPRDDREFRHRAAEVLGGIERGGRDDGELAEYFELRMRLEFPACVARSRSPLATFWPEGSAWYVYRDGSAVAGSSPTEAELAGVGAESIREISQEP